MVRSHALYPTGLRADKDGHNHETVEKYPTITEPNGYIYPVMARKLLLATSESQGAADFGLYLLRIGAAGTTSTVR